MPRSLSATARRLYRYLDKHFQPPKKTRITIDLRRLAHQHIGLSPGVELDKVRKRHIGPAAEELEDAGYLCKPISGRFEKLRRGVWDAVFELAEPAKRAKPQKHQRSRELVQALGRRGVSTATSLAILAGYTQDAIEQAIRAMDEQLGSGSVIRAPDRWLMAALKNGYRAGEATERASLRPERKLIRRGQNAG